MNEQRSMFVEVYPGVQTCEGIQGGEPCLAGTRWMTVTARNYNFDARWIASEYPHLTAEQIETAIAYERSRISPDHPDWHDGGYTVNVRLMDADEITALVKRADQLERQVAAAREVLALLKERADIYDRAASEGTCDETAYREVSVAFSALRRALEVK